jgi:hypothetical protein
MEREKETVQDKCRTGSIKRGGLTNRWVQWEHTRALIADVGYARKRKIKDKTTY